VGSAPSALGLLGPATASWARRAAQGAKWALARRRWPDPLRGAAALALTALDAAWAALLRPSLAGLLALLGAFALLSVAAGVASRKLGPVTAGVALLGAEYLASQSSQPVSVVPAAAFSVVLLAAMELAWWSSELSVRSAWERSAQRWRWALLAGLVVGAFALGVVVGLAGVSGLGPAPVMAVAGGLCAFLAALMVVSSVRNVSER
jgi:hypothetical protein